MQAANLPTIISGLPLCVYKHTCYRVVDFAALTGFNPMKPLYTLGPGVNGQRYTQKGGPSSLYASEDPITAEAEYHQVDRIVLVADPNYHMTSNPTVRLTIHVDLEHVLDIADPGVQSALGTSTAELTGPWRKQMIKKLYSPTHELAAAVYGNGSVQAMRYPSARGVDHCNLIIWDQRLALPSMVTVKDTTGTLSARIPPKRAYRRTH